MADPWAKLKAETRLAFGAFSDFLQMGTRRTLVDCAAEFDYRPLSLKTWSARHQWTDRSTAYDVQELARMTAQHEQKRAEIRQHLMEHGLEMAKVAVSVGAGRVSDPCICQHRKVPDDLDQAELVAWYKGLLPCRCGAWSPIRDREGDYIGDKPLVSPSTRYIAAAGVLDRDGVTVPKRVELTGADGEAIKLEAAAALGSLSGPALDALAAAFGDGDGDS